MIVYRSALVGM